MVDGIHVSKSEMYKLNKLLLKFSKLFELGEQVTRSKGASAALESAKPILMKARLVPYALEQKVFDEPDSLEKAAIISKTENSEKGIPIVPEVKPNGNVRICANFKTTVNGKFKDEHYRVPRIEEIFSKMNGGGLF